MTNNALNTLEIQQFESEVKHAYQETGNKLSQTTRFRRIQGESTRFPKLGMLTAAERGAPSTAVVLSNNAASSVTISTVDHTVAEMTDVFLQEKINFDAKAESAKSVAMACGRKVDQIIIDAFVANKGSYATDNVIAANSSNLTIAKLAAVSKVLDRQGVDDTDRFGLIDTNTHHSFTQQTEVASSDYNQQRVLATGKINSYYGYNFNVVGNLGTEGGLPVASDIRDNFFYHKSAIGTVMNMNIKVNISFQELYQSHLVVASFSCGSKLIDPLGVVYVPTSEA